MSFTRKVEKREGGDCLLFFFGLLLRVSFPAYVCKTGGIEGDTLLGRGSELENIRQKSYLFGQHFKLFGETVKKTAFHERENALQQMFVDTLRR